MATDLDIVRLKVGDTDADDQLLFDDEIQVCIDANTLTSEGEALVNLTSAAAEAAEVIAAKFARGYNFSTDGQSFNRSERVAHYQAVARELRRQGGVYSVPLVSSITAARNLAEDLG